MNWLHQEKQAIGSSEPNGYCLDLFSVRETNSEPGGTQDRLEDGVVHFTDAAGAITDRFAYSPYGVTTQLTGTNDTPYRFAGAFGCHTDSNGLVHMRARYYHPELKRFINADPIGFAGGMNWYAYANGNPLMYVDPSGLKAAQSTNPGNSGYGNFSVGAHGVLTAGGMVPGFGFFFDLIDLVYTIGEIPFGHSTWTDAALGTAAVAATLFPGTLDVAAGTAKIANRTLDAAVTAARNTPKPNYAPGSHSTFRTDPQTGRVTHYETRIPQTNPQNPNPWQVERRFDGTGRGHFNKATEQNVPTPHVHDPSVPGGVRPPLPNELPAGYP